MNVQSLKRHVLLQAHDTELWASYLPLLPTWFYPLGALGIILLLAAITGIPSNQPGIRVPLTAAGLLICTPLLALFVTTQRMRQRRAAVREQILNAVSWRGDEAVLDVGCGSGMLLNGAAARLQSGAALGIDIWAEHSGGGSKELLMKHARAEKVDGRIKFQEADARKMPFEDASFDVILSSWALHHISLSKDDFENACREMIRVLKPGGTIVVADVAHMIEALAMRLVDAGFHAQQQDTIFGQKIIIGMKIS